MTFAPTRGGMGVALLPDAMPPGGDVISKDKTEPVVVQTAVVVHLSTGDIVVTTFVDGTYTVEAVAKN